MSLTINIFCHLLSSIFCLQDYKYCKVWDNKLKSLLDNADSIEIKKYRDAKIHHKGDEIKVMSCLHSFSAIGCVQEINHVPVRRCNVKRPSLFTQIRLYNIIKKQLEYEVHKENRKHNELLKKL